MHKFAKKASTSGDYRGFASRWGNPK